MKRVKCFVDGFNLYHAVADLKINHLKWLNLRQLAQAFIRPTQEVLRKIVKMTQTDYARLVGVAPRIIIDLERGVGNPTLKTLEKIGRPFRLKINFQK